MSSRSAKLSAHAFMIPSTSMSLEMWFSLCCSMRISAVVKRLMTSRSAMSRRYFRSSEEMSSASAVAAVLSAVSPVCCYIFSMSFSKSSVSPKPKPFSRF